MRSDSTRIVRPGSPGGASAACAMMRGSASPRGPARQRAGTRTETLPDVISSANSTCSAWRCERVTIAASAIVTLRITQRIACIRFRRAGVYSPGLGIARDSNETGHRMNVSQATLIDFARVNDAAAATTKKLQKYAILAD